MSADADVDGAASIAGIIIVMATCRVVSLIRSALRFGCLHLICRRICVRIY